MTYKLNKNLTVGDVIMTRNGESIVKSIGLSDGKIIICHTFGVSVVHPFDKVESK